MHSNWLKRTTCFSNLFASRNYDSKKIRREAQNAPDEQKKNTHTHRERETMKVKRS